MRKRLLIAYGNVKIVTLKCVKEEKPLGMEERINYFYTYSKSITFERQKKKYIKNSWNTKLRKREMIIKTLNRKYGAKLIEC